MKIKQYQMKALVLGIGVALSGAAYSFSGTNIFGSGGGGSLVAQSSGLEGFGFTQDVMCYPSGYFYNSPAVGLGNIYSGTWSNEDRFTPVVTFQVKVDSPACNYIGMATSGGYLPSYGGMLTWNTGEVIEGSGGYDSRGYWSLPDQWVEIIYLPYSDDGIAVYIEDSFAVAAACGATPYEAMDNAQRIADNNANACN